MAADEEQSQNIVAVMGIVQPLGQRRRRTVLFADETMMSQAVGSRGGPLTGQFFSARKLAS